MLFNMFPKNTSALFPKNIGFHFIYSPIGLLIIGIRRRSVSRYPNDVIRTSWTFSENELKNLIPILVNPAEREMGFTHICSLERKDDKLIIILKYFIKAKGWKPIEVTQKGECLYTRLVLLIFSVFSVLLSTAAGNSCLLHLPEGFVSLVVRKVALVLQNAAGSQCFNCFKKQLNKFREEKSIKSN